MSIMNFECKNDTSLANNGKGSTEWTKKETKETKYLCVQLDNEGGIAKERRANAMLNVQQEEKARWPVAKTNCLLRTFSKTSLAKEGYVLECYRGKTRDGS